MKKIAEIIVVEGQNDTNRLKEFFEVDTIETGGFNMSEQVMERIAEAQKRRGVIVFTDPDPMGERLRTRIAKAVPEAKHAFIRQAVAKDEKRHKVGVEHAEYEDLLESLSHAVTFSEEKEKEKSLGWDEFLDLKIMGNTDRRQKVCEAFHIGHCSAKVCFKRLNQLGIRKEEIEEVLDD